MTETSRKERDAPMPEKSVISWAIGQGFILGMDFIYSVQKDIPLCKIFSCIFSFKAR